MINIRLILILALAIGTLTFTGCVAATPITKGTRFPKMYDQQPHSLLILPPMNESTDAEAKDYYMTTVEEPFAMMGYYIFPVEMVSDVMKQEGVYDTELLYNMPLDKFYEYFGADAVLFTTIKRWDVSYRVIASTLIVTIESKIVSTKTSEELWKYTGSVIVDLGGGGTGGGIAGLIINAIATAINTAAADYVTYARVANQNIIATLPAGPYHEMYLQDQDMKIIGKTARH